jgi:hypothetical protein
VQEALLDEALNVPVAHAEHCRSAVALGAFTTRVPAGQFDHGAQAVALDFALWLPFGQAEQARSASDDPAKVTTVPGAQSVCFAHGVAGLPSSSQVSLGQEELGAEPPAQNSPALHLLHVGPAVALAGAVMMVPAGQSVGATQAIWFAWDEVMPAWQGAQTRSLVALGTVMT